jgi:hypothetical protein
MLQVSFNRPVRGDSGLEHQGHLRHRIVRFSSAGLSANNKAFGQATPANSVRGSMKTHTTDVLSLIGWRSGSGWKMKAA